MRFQKFFMLCCIFLFSATSAIAQNGGKKWGLGAVIGDPTGLSVNYFFTDVTTLHTTIAWDADDTEELELASHYNWRKDKIAETKIPLGWFMGVGAKVLFYDRRHIDTDDDDFEFGPSGTLGLFYTFANVALEPFVKGNLTMNVIEDTDVNGDLMVGLHYNF